MRNKLSTSYTFKLYTVYWLHLAKSVLSTTNLNWFNITNCVLTVHTVCCLSTLTKLHANNIQVTVVSTVQFVHILSCMWHTILSLLITYTSYNVDILNVLSVTQYML